MEEVNRKVKEPIKHLNYTKGTFINLPGHHSDATIFSSVSVTDYNGSIEINRSLKIRDCSQTITLAIDLDTLDSFENSIFKLDTLIDDLKEYKFAVINARKTYLKVVEDGKNNSSKG